MSTKLHDLPTAAAYGMTFAPAVRTASADGAAVDLGRGDGPGFAILQVGALSAGGQVACVLEESDDQDAWDAIEDGEFPDVAAGTQTRAITFTRSRRYVRAALTLTGTTPSAGLAVLVGQQKKSF